METNTRSEHAIWVNFFVCGWLLIVPFAVPYASTAHFGWSDGVTALVIGVCSAAAMWLHTRQRLYDAIVLIGGAWLIVSPFALSYPPMRSAADMLLGSLVLVVTIIEMLPLRSQELT